MSKPLPKEKQKEIVKRYKNGESATSIGKDMGHHTTTITRILRRNGCSTGYKKGKDHPSWKGGKVNKGDGYVGIWKPDHPRADNQNYVYEHTLVMEEKIGRLPKKDEKVHHINCNKKDNRPENLYLCSNKKHRELHTSIEKMIPELLKKDIIGFDREKGEYYIK